MREPTNFPARWFTDETLPRGITLLGTAAMQPDVWVARIDGDDQIAWVVKASGGVCHPTTDVLRVHARPDEDIYDDGSGSLLAASRFAA